MDAVYKQIKEHKVVAIVRGVDSKVVRSIAESLYAGGIRLLEITCNTQSVLEIIKDIADLMDGRMLVGAGTVTSLSLAEAVHKAGARYILAPDVNPEVIGYSVKNNIAVVPGATTATEILTANRLGAEMVKLFPAGALGTEYIEQLRGPLNNIDLLAVGGVDSSNIAEMIEAGCVGVGIGSSLVKKSIIENEDWAGLEKLARECVELTK